MAEDPQNKNQVNEDQAVEQHIEEMLGPPPQDEKPHPPAPQPTPAEQTPPPAPLPIPEATAEDQNQAKEKVLVIPASDQPPAKAAPASEPVDIEQTSNSPTAGATIVPTNPEAQIGDMQQEPVKKKKDDPPQKGSKFKRFLRKWWRTPLYRNLTLGAAFAILIGIGAWPASRYFLLNSFGVRSSASLTVLDNSTQLPLKNVNVSLGGQEAKTNEEGYVRFHNIKLGRAQLNLQKRAFANTSKNITIGWGSNPLGNFSVDPTGSQYIILVKDWLTGKNLAGASAQSGDADANSDQNGKIVLTIDPVIAQADTLEVTVRADKYRDQNLTLDLGSKLDRTANMVIARKDVFVTNRSGKYDVYSVDIDGKNEKLVLAGSGLEKDDIVLVQHPTDEVAALVSSRINARNSDGYLLNTLTLIDLSDNTTKAVAQSEQVQLIGWIANRLIFVQIQAGASGANPDRFKLISYDYKTGTKKELAAANSFNDVMLDGGLVYYAPSSAYQKDPAAGLIRTNADGTSKKTILKDEVWNIFRVDYNRLTVATEKEWYGYTIGSTDEPSKIEEPANPKNRLYIGSPDNKHSLWIDQRDGKGHLISHDNQDNTDTTLVAKRGLVYPVKWLNDEVFIYRVKNGEETADYVMDINGGKAHKVTDLYNAAGIDRWYFY